MQYIDRLLLKDARLISEVLPQDYPLVDVTITSPPYWNLKNYGSVKNQIGFGQSKDQYLADVEKILKDCLSITKPTGSLWLVVNDLRDDSVLQLLPWELADRARKVGWILREQIIWDKQHSVPWQTKGRMRGVSEFIFFMTKTDNYKFHVDRIKMIDEISKWWVDFPERFNPKGKTPTNIWSIPFRVRGTWRKPSEIEHYCAFPTKLVSRIVELTTDEGDLVFDPFAGSGVVLAQAAAMGRQFTGFEINKQYVEAFKKITVKEVAKEWEEIQQYRKNEHIVRNGFEKTVIKLRALKYSCQVTRPFLEIMEPDQVNRIKAIICDASIPKQHYKDQHFDVNIFVVVDSDSEEFQLALEAALERSTKPPFTQYGIKSKIQVVPYRNIIRRKYLANKRFYLYSYHRPRTALGCSKLQNWFVGGRLEKFINKSKIPLLANVEVDVAWAME